MVTHAHSAEPDSRNIQVAVSEFALLHFLNSCLAETIAHRPNCRSRDRAALSYSCAKSDAALAKMLVVPGLILNVRCIRHRRRVLDRLRSLRQGCKAKEQHQQSPRRDQVDQWVRLSSAL